ATNRGKRLAPLEVERDKAADRNRHLLEGRSAKVVQRAARENSGPSATVEPALPGLAAVVSGSGEVGDTLRGDGVGGLGDDAFLEEGLVEVTDVIDLDVGVRLALESHDVLGKRRGAQSTGGKGQRGGGGFRVDDLAHRAAFVRAPCVLQIENVV